MVSTDFVETINDATAERGAIFNTADTTTINTLPYTDVVLLTDQGSIVVDVANPSDTPATVRLQVNLDTGQSPYDRTAIMSEGGALRFVFSFFSPTFGSP